MGDMLRLLLSPDLTNLNETRFLSHSSSMCRVPGTHFFSQELFGQTGFPLFKNGLQQLTTGSWNCFCKCSLRHGLWNQVGLKDWAGLGENLLKCQTAWLVFFMDYSKFWLCFAMFQAFFHLTPFLHCIIVRAPCKFLDEIGKERIHCVTSSATFLSRGWNWQGLIKGFTPKLAADSPSREQQ